MSDIPQNLRTAGMIASAVGGAAAAAPAASAAFYAMIPMATAVPGGPLIAYVGVIALGALAGPAVFTSMSNHFGWPR